MLSHSTSVLHFSSIHIIIIVVVVVVVIINVAYAAVIVLFSFAHFLQQIKMLSSLTYSAKSIIEFQIN